jgi:hypothetical protein
LAEIQAKYPAQTADDFWADFTPTQDYRIWA